MDLSQRHETIDLLLDLKHDLGKYLRLPLAWLPDHASNDDVRSALSKALFTTRTNADGSFKTAATIWCEFKAESTPLTGHAGWHQMQNAVERALKWETTMATEEIIDRDRAKLELSNVYDVISTLIEEVKNGR
jgi:hypothetical protein